MSAASPRRAAVNVDVDGLYLYERIHGRGGEIDPATHDAIVWTRGVPRFLDLFARTSIRATFFVVAQDLAHPDVRAVARDVLAAGHELASHTWSHPYNLTKRGPLGVRVELRRAKATIETFSGVRCAGFRAPGYVTTRALLEAVSEIGHDYDSSIFPCPTYQAAKMAVIGLYALLGRPSQSVVDDPLVSLARTAPHLRRMNAHDTLWEFPIAVLPGTRLPFIGTSLLWFGEAGWALTRPQVARMGFVNFECHGIDLTDHQADGISDALLAQPDQRVPLARKWPLFVKAMETIVSTHEVRTLAEWAEEKTP